MVVRVCVYRFALPNRFENEIDPTAQFLVTINYDLVPSLDYCFDFLPVPQPPNVCEVSSDGIELERDRISHPGAILEHQGHAKLPQDIGKIAVEPVLVPQFNRKLLVRGQLLEERHQTLKKQLPVAEYVATEKWELENDGTEFLPEKTHCVQKFFPFGVTIDEHFVVRNRLRDLHREDEVVRRLREPAVDGLGGWASVEGRIHFNGIELVRVVRQIVRRLEATGIERAFPTGGGERRGSEMNCRRHDSEYTW